LLSLSISSFCTVGSRIIKQVSNCSKDVGGDLWQVFCALNETAAGSYTVANATEPDMWSCDPYFAENPVGEIQGIKGLQSGIFWDNVKNKYHPGGDALSNNDTSGPEYNLGGHEPLGYITTDIYTTFTILVGIFFPSCTGECALWVTETIPHSPSSAIDFHSPAPARPRPPKAPLASLRESRRRHAIYAERSDRRRIFMRSRPSSPCSLTSRKWRRGRRRRRRCIRCWVWEKRKEKLWGASRARPRSRKAVASRVGVSSSPNPFAFHSI